MWEMIPLKKAIGPSKELRKYTGDRIYRETVSEIFSLYALAAPTFRAKQLT
jgi:hypothetical protein